jgi:hypothetical protein
MIPVKSAVITISTCFAEQADQLTDIKAYFQIHGQLFNILTSDDTEELVNWYDGRPKSMLLTIWTSNQAVIQYAFSQGLVDEEVTIESSIREYLQSQEICCECIEAIMDEFITAQVTLKQNADGRLSVDFGGELVGI